MMQKDLLKRCTKDNTKQVKDIDIENITVFVSALDFHTIVWIGENLRGVPQIFISFSNLKPFVAIIV